MGFLFLDLHPSGVPASSSHTPSFVTHQLCLTPSLHKTLSHTMFHTTLSHSIFLTPSLSHTTLSHTIFHIQLCHTHTHNFVAHHLSNHFFTYNFTHNVVTHHLSHTWWHPRTFCVTGVLLLTHGCRFAWQAWHFGHMAGPGDTLGSP